MNRKEMIGLVEKQTVYDAKTVRIDRNGFVTAKHDPDKQPGCDSIRRIVCHVSQLDRL